jgi:hypothetical protein
MHSVVETPTFATAADRAGLTESMLGRVIDAVAAEPRGSKPALEIEGLYLRVLRRTETGAEEDVEVLHYFAGDDIPVFLLDIAFIGEPLSLTKRQRVELAETLSEIAPQYRASVRAKVVEFKSKPNG